MLNQAPYEWTIRQLLEHARSGRRLYTLQTCRYPWYRASPWGCCKFSPERADWRSSRWG
jgi:hypothetical protein